MVIMIRSGPLGEEKGGETASTPHTKWPIYPIKSHIQHRLGFLILYMKDWRPLSV
jgi:hypothetical protein